MNSNNLLRVHSDTTELQKEDLKTKNILSQNTLEVKLDIYQPPCEPCKSLSEAGASKFPEKLMAPEAPS